MLVAQKVQLIGFRDQNKREMGGESGLVVKEMDLKLITSYNFPGRGLELWVPFPSSQLCGPQSIAKHRCAADSKERPLTEWEGASCVHTHAHPKTPEQHYKPPVPGCLNP